MISCSFTTWSHFSPLTFHLVVETLMVSLSFSSVTSTSFLFSSSLFICLQCVAYNTCKTCASSLVGGGGGVRSNQNCCVACTCAHNGAFFVLWKTRVHPPAVSDCWCHECTVVERWGWHQEGRKASQPGQVWQKKVTRKDTYASDSGTRFAVWGFGLFQSSQQWWLVCKSWPAAAQHKLHNDSIHYALFQCGMRLFLIKERLCATHTHTHAALGLCVCLYRNWKKQCPYRLNTRLSSVVNSEGSVTGQCQSRKTRARSSASHCYTQAGRERGKEGRGCLWMVRGKLQPKPTGRKNGCSLVWRMQSRGNAVEG